MTYRGRHLPWSIEEGELVLALLVKGFSAAMISDEFSRSVRRNEKGISPRSRNAIIGYAMRSNISLMKSPPNSGQFGNHSSDEKAAEQKNKKREYMKAYRLKKAHGIVAADRAEKINNNVVVRRGLKPEPALSINIMELKENSCRWPIGDDAKDMRYCGHSSFAHFSYCEAHASASIDHTQRERYQYVQRS